MRKKILASVLLAVAVLANSMICPAFCNLNMTYSSTVTLSVADDAIPDETTVDQMEAIATALSGYLGSTTHKFLYRNLTANEFFPEQDSALAKILRTILSAVAGAQQYRTNGKITPSDSFFGGDYAKALSKDKTIKKYISNYTWEIVYANNVFTITVSQVAEPHTTLVCTAGNVSGGTVTLDGELPSDTIEFGGSFVKS